MAKRSRKHINRVIALLASLVLAFGLVPVSASAAGEGPDNPGDPVPADSQAASAEEPDAPPAPPEEADGDAAKGVKSEEDNAQTGPGTSGDELEEIGDVKAEAPVDEGVPEATPADAAGEAPDGSGAGEKGEPAGHAEKAEPAAPAADNGGEGADVQPAEPAAYNGGTAAGGQQATQPASPAEENGGAGADVQMAAQAEADAEGAEAEYPAFRQSKTINGVTVTVEAGAGAFPEGARLSVAAVPSSRTEAAVAPERGAGENVAVSYTFDIKVLGADGEELQPADGKTVRVSFQAAEVADSNLDVSVYHVADDAASADELDVDVSGTIASAESDGFSYYTVEFTYGELQYVLPGDSEVALSEVLGAIGLTGEPTAAVSSAPDLFDVEKRDGAWVVVAKQAFLSNETLTVTINDLAYEIAVTDYNIGLWIGGRQVNISNSLAYGDGWRYEGNEHSGTLTLTNATIQGGIRAKQELTIVLEGDSTINADSSTSGIHVENGNGDYHGGMGSGNLTITGGGSLTVQGNSGIYADYIISISGTTVNATGTGDSGIDSGGSIAINDSNVSAKGYSECGIHARGAISIGNSTVACETASGSAMWSEREAITLGEGLAVTEPEGGRIEQGEIWNGNAVARKAVIGPSITYPLWVGGRQVTSVNVSNIPVYGGPASFDPETNTLTLSGAETEGVHPFGESRTAGIYADGIDLTIVLDSQSFVRVGSPTDAIAIENGSLTIKGSGSLYAVGGNGIWVDGPITIDGGELDCRGSSGYGMYAGAGGITVNSGSVSASGAGEHGICADFGGAAGSSITVNDGALSASGAKDGIHCGGILTANGGLVAGTGTTGHGVYAGNYISMQGGKIAGETKSDDLGRGGIASRSYIEKTDSGAMPDVVTEPQGGTIGQYPSDGYNRWFVMQGDVPARRAVIEPRARYNLWVGDSWVANDNRIGEGWSYEGDDLTGTLTLTNANITGWHTGSDASAGIYVDGQLALTIVLVGDNTVGNGSADYGIESWNGPLSITGAGTLTVHGSTTAIASRAGFSLGSGLAVTDPDGAEVGESGGWHYILSGSVPASTATIGPSGYYDLWVGGVRVNASNKDSIPVDSGTAAFDPATGTLTLSNASVTSGDDADGAAVRASGINLKVTGSGTLNGASYGVLVQDGSLTLDATNITATGGADGIRADDDIAIVSGTVTGAGEGFGICAGGDITIEGGTVGGTGEDSGICAGGDITVRGGTVTGTSSGANGTGIDAGGSFSINDGKVTGEGVNGGIVASEEIDLAEGMAVKEPIGGTIGKYDGKSYVLDGSAPARKAVIEPSDYYDLWVGGVQVTSVNQGNIPVAAGAATFDPSTNTLALTNATINGEVYFDYLALKIELAGENTISNDNRSIYGGFDASLTIGGGGTLTVLGGRYGIYSGNELAIDDATLTTEGDYCGIYADDVTINNATVLATARSNYGYGDGINALGKLTIIGCSKVTGIARGSREKYGGIYAHDGIDFGAGVSVTDPADGRIGSYNGYGVHVLDSSNKPAKTVTIEQTGFLVTVLADPAAGGTANADMEVGHSGDTVTLMATPNNGYRFDEWQVVSGGVTIQDSQFTIGNDHVIVKAVFTPKSATMPTIATQPANLDLVYGELAHATLNVAANPIAGHTISYQWYLCNSAGGGKRELGEATDASYAIPANASAGLQHYICTVTATRDDNGEEASVDSSVAAVDIAKRGITVSVENASLPYNGKEQSGETECTFTDLLSGHTASIAYTPAAGTDASPTAYKGSFGDFEVVDGSGVNVTANYELTGQTLGTLTITKAPVTITIPSGEKYYGNTDPAFADAVMSGQVAGELTDVSLAVARSDATDDALGEHTGVLSIDQTASQLEAAYPNYTFTVTPGNFTVKENDLGALTVSADNVEATYNGEAHGVVATPNLDGAVVKYWNEGTGAYDLDSSPTWTDFTDGAKIVKFQATLYGYANATGEATVTVAKRPVTVSVADKQVVRSVSEQTGETACVFEGPLEGHIATITYTPATGADTGIYTGAFGNDFRVMAGDRDVSDNYELIMRTPGRLVIGKYGAVSVESSTRRWTYDGATHVSKSYTITLGDESHEVSVADDAETAVATLSTADKVTITPTAAGVRDYDAGYSENNTFAFELENAGDYETATASFGTLSIKKAAVTIKVADASKEAGEADPAFAGTVTGLVADGDLGEIKYVRMGNDEDADFYKGVLTATYTENANYDVNVVNGDFTIKAKLAAVWLDGDGSVLQTKTYAEGDEPPAYDGKTPSKAATAQCTYIFTGWDSGTVEGTTTTYKPLFDEKEMGIYEVVSGAGGTWTEGSGEPLVFTFKRKVDDQTSFDHFTGILVDGEAVSQKDSSGNAYWTARRGSVIVALQPSYLATLSSGAHTIAATFDDGDPAVADFAVSAPATHTVTFDANGTIFHCRDGPDFI